MSGDSLKPPKVFDDWVPSDDESSSASPRIPSFPEVSGGNSDSSLSSTLNAPSEVCTFNSNNKYKLKVYKIMSLICQFCQFLTIYAMVKMRCFFFRLLFRLAPQINLHQLVKNVNILPFMRPQLRSLR